MSGIYLLFFTSFLFFGDSISHLKFRSRKDSPKILSKDSPSHTNFAKYIFAIFATIFCALPIFFALWDYYSLAKLFYSLFGGISIFSALLMARFVLDCILRDFNAFIKRFTQRFARFPFQNAFSPNPTNPRTFLVIFIFSFALFLGHLDLIIFDIFSSNKAIITLFVGVFIIALYFADKIAGILALIAFTTALFHSNNPTQNAIFALFDGYLLIYSVIFSVIWGIRKVFF